MEHIEELRRLASLDMPEWSEELTALVDPVLEALSDVLSRDRQTRDAVIAFLDEPADSTVVRWLSRTIFPDLRVNSRRADGTVPFADMTVPALPALFLAEDEVSAPPKKLRTMRKPWEAAIGWHFGSPQESAGTRAWPVGRDGRALDFIFQVDLAKAACAGVDIGVTGLSEAVTLQLFVDLDTEFGPVDHQVVAFTAADAVDAVMRPPRGADVNAAAPSLISPVECLTLPRAGRSGIGMTDAGARAFQRLTEFADGFPYQLNVFREPGAAADDEGRSGLEHVPMARLGGHPVIESGQWDQQAAEALDCDSTSLATLHDGPVDPEPRPVDDPSRPRLTVVIEKSRLQAADFSHTFAVAY